MAGAQCLSRSPSVMTQGGGEVCEVTRARREAEKGHDLTRKSTLGYVIRWTKEDSTWRKCGHMWEGGE